MRHFYIEEKLYQSKPLFVFNCSVDELASFLKRRFDIDDDYSDLEDATGSVFRFKKSPHRVVWLQSFDRNNDEDHGRLHHEVGHLVTRICADKGIHPAIPNHENGEVGDETHAYMGDFFVREFLARARKK